MRYILPFGTKTKTFVHKRLIVPLQPTYFDKQLKEFNEKILKIMDQPFDEVVKTSTTKHKTPKNKTKKIKLKK